ncbi:MAG: citrate/2-methylcitrate synthase [Calditrichota bacterium]|jgi:citrate synthase
MSQDFIKYATDQLAKTAEIDRDLYTKFSVKRGLRNEDGSGVLVGLTKISSVIGFKIVDEEVIPVDGELYYRGIHINDLVAGVEKEKRYGFIEVIYLLIFGKLPNQQELENLRNYLNAQSNLPPGLNETSILGFPSPSVMNKLQRVVLVLYGVDPNPDDISIPNVVKQCLDLIAKFPTIIAYSYQAMRHKLHGESLFVHPPNPTVCCAENFLYMLRPDRKYTELEADILDLALTLHADHGGGNNSTFTTHVVTSSNTDTYSAISAAVGSLKGPLHGAANSYVMDMMSDIKENVKDWNDDDELSRYLERMLRGEVHDKQGLIYGLGHAVYTKSDPRAIILKNKAKDLAAQKGRSDEHQLYLNVERLSPALFQKIKKSNKVISPNVDFYSGFVYDLLGFPRDIYTPLFAMARVVGWSAHRIEELINGRRIIRPAYKNVSTPQKYIPLSQRK